VLWYIFVFFPVRKKYEQLVSSKSKALVSSTDREIGNRCEATLKMESLLDEHIESAGIF